MEIKKLILQGCAIKKKPSISNRVKDEELLIAFLKKQGVLPYRVRQAIYRLESCISKNLQDYGSPDTIK